MNKQLKPASLIIHGGHQANEHNALVSPLVQSATFAFETAEQGGARFSGEQTGPIYTRLGNPTTAELERKMALLEGCNDAIAFGSGMGAIAATLLAHLSKVTI